VPSLSADVRQALTGAKPGDFRLATGPDGRFYILSVLEVTPARRQSLEEVTMAIAQKVFNVKLERSLEDWAEKLKQEARVEIFLVQ
jgi:parvulin-like peptidyl-prolyl isomerase